MPEWPGFSKVFGLRAVAADAPGAHVQLPADLDSRIDATAKPDHVLADEITRALRAFGAAARDYDVLMILLPERWQAGFEGREDDAFDLHDYIKARLAMRGLPSQIIREAKALSYFCRYSVAWRIGEALYCKAGGVPWKLADAEPEAAYIGLSYRLRPCANGGERFVTCCSQVFDADGAGVEFIASETADYRIFGDNPFLSRAENAARDGAQPHALPAAPRGPRSPARGRAQCPRSSRSAGSRASSTCSATSPNVELVQVKQESGWRGLRMDPPSSGSSRGGEPAKYPLERGTLLALGGTEALLWTADNAPEGRQRPQLLQGGQRRARPADAR